MINIELKEYNFIILLDNMGLQLLNAYFCHKLLFSSVTYLIPAFGLEYHAHFRLGTYRGR